MAHHKDLTGADLHEPKGIAGASANTVYVANGSGSGTWTALKSSQVALTRVILDVSTAGDVYIPVPCDGTISFITAVLDAGITTANSVVTFSIGGVSIDSSTLTITAASAAGAEFDSTPSGHNTVVAGDVIKISTDGGSTGTAALAIVVLINAS